MSKEEKKRQSIYDLLNAETKPKFLSPVYKAKKKVFPERDFFKEKNWKVE